MLHRYLAPCCLAGLILTAPAMADQTTQTQMCVPEHALTPEWTESRQIINYTEAPVCLPDAAKAAVFDIDDKSLAEMIDKAMESNLLKNLKETYTWKMPPFSNEGLDLEPTADFAQENTLEREAVGPGTETNFVEDERIVPNPAFEVFGPIPGEDMVENDAVVQFDIIGWNDLGTAKVQQRSWS